MTLISQINDNLWTEKHEKICLEKGISGATQKLWCWLVQHFTPTKQIIISLKDFNDVVARIRGKGYDRKHLKSIFNKLIENRFVRIVHQCSWHEFVLYIKPLSYLNPPKIKGGKKSQNGAIPPSEAQEPTESFDFEAEIFDKPKQQQNNNLEETMHVAEDTSPNFERIDLTKEVTSEEKRNIRNACYQADIHLPDNCEVYFYPLEEVKFAIELVKRRMSRSLYQQKAPNRIGMLITCLREMWWDEYENKHFLITNGLLTEESPYYDYYSSPVGDVTDDKFVKFLRIFSTNA